MRCRPSAQNPLSRHTALQPRPPLSPSPTAPPPRTPHPHLGNTVLEELNKRIEEAGGVEQADGLCVEAQLLPRQHLHAGEEAVAVRSPAAATVTAAATSAQ